MRRIAGVIAVSSAMSTVALFELIIDDPGGGAMTFFAGSIGFVINIAICLYGDD